MIYSDTVILMDNDIDFLANIKATLDEFCAENKLALVISTNPADLQFSTSNPYSAIILFNPDLPCFQNRLDFMNFFPSDSQQCHLILLASPFRQQNMEFHFYYDLFEIIEKSSNATLLLQAIQNALLFSRNKQAMHRQLNDLLKTIKLSSPGKDSVENASRGNKILNGMVGCSREFKQLLTTIERVASSEATCMIIGESGTGKDLVAKAIHEGSNRAHNDFVVVHCGITPANFIETLLFGEEKGENSTRDSSKIGSIGQAHRGTLFLDDVTRLPYDLQSMLLQFLQDGIIQRSGKCRKVDVRIIAASYRDPLQEVHNGTFREDLYYRLNVITIHIPPLCERKEDIPDLAHHFLRTIAQLEGKGYLTFENGVIERFQNYQWPGNIRELRNVIHRMVLFAEGKVLFTKDLPVEITARGPLSFNEVFHSVGAIHVGERKPEQAAGFPYNSLKEMEKESIIKALHNSRNNKEHAAQQLGISRASIYRKIKEYNISIVAKSKSSKGI